MDFSFFLILFNALMLGFRHGIDWDHIAAITDLMGTTSNIELNNGVISIGVQKYFLRLPFFYAAGHAAMVASLGLMSIFFASVITALQAGCQPLIERLVGLTLLLLGVWIFYSIFRATCNGHSFVPQSRWMLLWSFVRDRLGLNAVYGDKQRQPEAPVAFIIGLIHGIGAETVTQLTLFAAISGATSQTASVMMLALFIAGLLASNAVVAIVSGSGYICASLFRPLMIMTSALTGVFSCIVGFRLITGCSGHLLNLH
jgi:high-affinity nickel permease